mgnify:CR=1 FL=1
MSEFIVASSPTASAVALVTTAASTGTGHCQFAGGHVFTGAGSGVCEELGSSFVRGAPVRTPSVLSLWVWPRASPSDAVDIWCDMDVAGGGWTHVFSTSRHDSSSSIADLRHRTYAPGTELVLRGSREVMLASLDRDGRVAPNEYVILPMPHQWKQQHPASFHGVDVEGWTASTADGVVHNNVTLRFGFGGLATGGDDHVCGGGWRAAVDGAFFGRVCLHGAPTSPAWFGFASRFVVDQCGSSNHAPCTASNQFAMFVR